MLKTKGSFGSQVSSVVTLPTQMFESAHLAKLPKKLSLLIFKQSNQHLKENCLKVTNKHRGPEAKGL